MVNRPVFIYVTVYSLALYKDCTIVYDGGCFHVATIVKKEHRAFCSSLLVQGYCIYNKIPSLTQKRSTFRISLFAWGEFTDYTRSPGSFRRRKRESEGTNFTHSQQRCLSAATMMLH